MLFFYLNKLQTVSLYELIALFIDCENSANESHEEKKFVAVHLETDLRFEVAAFEVRVENFHTAVWRTGALRPSPSNVSSPFALSTQVFEKVKENLFWIHCLLQFVGVPSLIRFMYIAK